MKLFQRSKVSSSSDISVYNLSKRGAKDMIREKVQLPKINGTKRNGF